MVLHAVTSAAFVRIGPCSSLQASEHGFHGGQSGSLRDSSWLKVRYNVVPSRNEGCSLEVSVNDKYSDEQGAVCSPDMLIREALLGDLWEVSDTHCGAFFPDVKFPMDYILRGDRAMSLIGNLVLPKGQKRICLVALEDDEIGIKENTFFPFLQARKVSGALTMDTLAEFLPRRKPMNRRRSGIAYVSNVAVRLCRRRRGIARRLMREAQKIARSWGCRSMALHVDLNNAGAEGLYLKEGFKPIKIAAAAKWPRPHALPGANLQLMMKLLGSNR